MSTQYESEIYRFFTEPSNFETMVAVASHADNITKTVIKDFWDELKLELSKKIEPIGKEWKVDYSGDFYQRYAKLQITHRNWLDIDLKPIFSISFEDLHFGEYPFVGISLNRENPNYEMQLIKTHFENANGLKGYERDSHEWWANYKWLPFDLSQRENLRSILPLNRRGQIENAVREVLELIQIVEPEALTALKLAKKSKAS